MAAAAIVIQEKEYREPESVPFEAVDIEKSSHIIKSEPKEDEPYLDTIGEIGFEVSSLTVSQGGFIVMKAYDINPLEIKLSSPFNVNPVWVAAGDHFSALIPVKFTYEEIL